MCEELKSPLHVKTIFVSEFLLHPLRIKRQMGKE